jgi:transcriptional regulator with PAS, ATPase and Fis domain
MPNPTPRTVKNALAKALDALLSPVYLLDSEGTVVYVNKAMLQWADCPLEQVIGAKCLYSATESSDSTQRFNGLAPPPDKLKPGSTITGCQISLASSGQLQERLCDFVACATPEDPDNVEFVAAFVAAADLVATTEVNSDVYDAEKLHADLGRLQHQLQQRFHLDSLVGNSEFAVRLRKQVVAAGGNALEMTIVGPPGSGRQHLARTIHQRRITTAPIGTDADRNPAPGLAAILQGAIADAQLVQSSVRQAIAFATENQSENRGRAGGRHLPVAWLIVLEADQLTAEAQTELWSALNDSRSDVRVIATSELDLIRAATDGTFHQGLAWRINTLVIDTLPLKQRSADIPMLAQYFLEQQNAGRAQQIGRFDNDAIEMLTEYHWPGNLQQLRSVIGQAADTCTNAVINRSELPETFHHALKALRVNNQQTDVHIDLDQYLENIEAKLISRAIRVAKGNKTQTAKLLGMNRAKLLRRIQHLALDDEATAAKTGQRQPAIETQVDFQPVDEADEDAGPRNMEARE